MALSALLAYFGAYVCLRCSHQMVHRVAWEFDPVGAGEPKAPAIHWVCFGSSRWNGIGFSGPYECYPPSFRYYPGEAAVWYVFSPSAELERTFWRIMKPEVFASDSIFDAEREAQAATKTGPARGSQPSSSASNPTSSAAGSRR